MTQDVCIFFLPEVLMTVDATMVINIFSGLPGMRNMGLAKQPHQPNNPVLPYPWETMSFLIVSHGNKLIHIQFICYSMTANVHNTQFRNKYNIILSC